MGIPVNELLSVLDELKELTKTSLPDDLLNCDIGEYTISVDYNLLKRFYILIDDNIFFGQYVSFNDRNIKCSYDNKIFFIRDYDKIITEEDYFQRCLTEDITEYKLEDLKKINETFFFMKNFVDTGNPY